MVSTFFFYSLIHFFCLCRITINYFFLLSNDRNERGYNIPYIEALRASLNSAGFTNTKIVVADSSFDPVSKDILNNPQFAAAVDIIGAHYPNMNSGADAEATGKTLWASEEDSTYNNAVGAGCWARVINQNYGM